MTSYNGEAITYDEIGNPLTYRDSLSFTWKNGRQLASLQNGNSVVDYTYNYNYRNASWNLTYSTGQGGIFTKSGKILTFWYR